MAQAIKSPTSARPSALPSAVPGEQKISAEEQALLAAADQFSLEEQQLLDAASAFQPQQQADSQSLFQQMMAAPSRSFWTGEPTTGAENFQQGLSTTAELLGSAPVVAGTAAGAMLPIPGGALAGGMAGAVVQKDVTNLVRKAFGLSSNEDRSRLLDVAFASLSALPGLGGQAAMRNAMAGGNASADLVFESASPEAQAAYQSMKAAVQDQMKKNEIGPEQAAEIVGSITSNLQKYVGDYSEAGVLKGLSEAFGKKLEVQNKVNELALSVSPETITQESMVKGNLTNFPKQVIALKEKLINKQWRTAYEELKQMRGIETIDTDLYIQKLRNLRESVKIDPGAAKLVDNVIENVSGYQSVINETRDLGALARGTGGKTPKYYDMQTGQTLSEPGPKGNIPFPETQEALVKSGQEPVYMPTARAESLPPSGRGGKGLTFETLLQQRPEVALGERVATYPESEQLGLSLRGPQVPLTAEQKAAGLLPPKIVDNFHMSMMESIDSLIIKRQRLDELASTFPKGSEKRRLYGAAAKSLRTVEDDFIDRLAMEGGSKRQTAMSYKMAKEGLFDIKNKAEQLGKSVDREAFEFADALDRLPIQKTKAFAAVMPMEVRQKVLRRYWDNLINPIFGEFEGTLTMDQAKKLRSVYNPERGARFEVLSEGMGSPVSNLKGVTEELAKLTMRASKIDPGAMLKSPLFPRLLKAGATYIGMGAPVDAMVKLASNGNEQAAKIALDRFLTMNFDDIVSSVDRSNSSQLVSWMKNTAGSDSPKVQRFIDTLANMGLAASQLKTPVNTQIAGQTVRAANQ